MKFLCPSCKAKYQIADEKVAGRSVRMKCRKCGFVIPISEIPPAPPTMPPDEAGWAAPPAVVPRAPAPPVVTSQAGAPAPPSPASPSPLAPPVSPSPGPARPAPPPSRVAAPPKPAAPGGHRRPTLADVKLGPPKTGPGPAAPAVGATKPSAATATAKAPVPKPIVPASGVPTGGVSLLSALEDEDDGEHDDATHIVKGGALADAFGALVGGAPADPNELGMPADEWFVGINDVPVGPIRLGEIRKRAMIGAITPESMVWRDGLEAWRPLKTFPELVAVLEESMSSVRASAAPLVRPAAGAPVPSRSDADSFAAAGASGGITGAAVVTDDLAAAGLARGRTPMVAWLAVVVALGFGVTIGFVWFGKQKPPETVIKYVEVPAKGEASPVAAAARGTQPGDVAGPAASAAATKARTGTHVASKASDTSADKGGGLSGLKGLSALGPSGPGISGATPGTTPAGGGGQLDGAQIQTAVGRYTGSVKRSCWQPSLDARAPGAPTSARVVVTITVGATGSVQNVTTSGDPRGYPGLASCIAGRVRAWQFPASGGTTTANVPFVFAAQ